MTTRTTIPSPPPRSFAHVSRLAINNDDDLVIEPDDGDDDGLVPNKGSALAGAAQLHLPTTEVHMYP